MHGTNVKINDKEFLSPKSVKVKAKQHCSGHVKPRTRVQACQVRVSGCLSSAVTGYSGHSIWAPVLRSDWVLRTQYLGACPPQWLGTQDTVSGCLSSAVTGYSGHSIWVPVLCSDWVLRTQYEYYAKPGRTTFVYFNFLSSIIPTWPAYEAGTILQSTDKQKIPTCDKYACDRFVVN